MATAPNTLTPAGNQTAWDSLMELYLAARDEFDRYREQTFNPLADKAKRIWPKMPIRCPETLEAYKKWTDESGYDRAADKLDALCEVFGDREDALMAYPAPGPDALLWKLDRVLEPEDGTESTPCWDMRYVRQTVEDYRRILGSAQ